MVRFVKAFLMAVGGFFVLMIPVTAVLGLTGTLDHTAPKPPAVPTSSAAPSPQNLPATSTTARYLIGPGRGSVIVWRDRDAMVRGLKIAFSGEGMRALPLVKPLMACGAASGSKIIVDVDATDWSSVLVLSGAATGCQGVVPNVFIMDTPDPAAHAAP